MTPVPSLKLPETAGRTLITGRRLSELLRALRARTPLEAARHAATASRMPPVPLPSYQPGKTYVMSASFMRNLAAAVAGRALPPSEPSTPGAPPALADTSAGLAALLDTLHRNTPDQPSAASPLGYRLPSATTGMARLEWDIETSQGYSTVCSLGESFFTPGHWVLSNETAQVFTLGSYVDSATASGVISAYGPDETPPACDEPVYDSTQDLGFDYGDFVSSDYSEALLAFEATTPDAIGAVDVLGGLASSAQEWPSESWQAVSNGDIPFSLYCGPVAASASVTGATATSTRFRLRNRGSCAIRVDCGFYGSGMAGGATDDLRSLTLPPGAASDWITPPAIDPDPAKGRSAEIRRIRLSRWLSVP
jgi:hypothetical protein